MHFAVVAPPLAGHLNPLLVLGRALIARGHRVTVIGRPDVEAMVAGSGVGFHAVGAATHPPGSLEAMVARMGSLGLVAGVRATIADTAAATDMLAGELPGAIEAVGADAVIADQMEAAGGLVAMGLGLPHVTTATGLPINREMGVPPPYVPWGWYPGWFGFWLNRGGWRVTDRLMAGVNRVIAAHARRFGLTGVRRTEDCLSPALEVAQCVGGLDFPRAELSPAFRYAGPWRHGEVGLDFEDDGRPLAYCSLGTIQGGRAGLFRAVAGACADLGLRLVIAHGGRLSEADIAQLPGGPVVRAFVDQRAVLARAAVAVTHAGFNTVLDALSCGRPIVAIPLAFEQPATAARLVRAGAGSALAGPASRARVRRAIATVLDEPAYHAAAGRLAAEIAAAGGVERAADLIEALPGISRPQPHAAAAR